MVTSPGACWGNLCPLVDRKGHSAEAARARRSVRRGSSSLRRLCDPELDAKLRGALEEALGSDGRSLNPKAACHPTAARAALCGLARHVARMQSGPEMALTLAEMSPLEEHSGSDTVLLDGRVVESLGLDGAGALLEKMDTCATLGGSAKLR